MKIPSTVSPRFLIVLTSVHVLFFVIKLILGDYMLVDSGEYVQLARNIGSHLTAYSGDLSGDLNPALYTRRTAGYPIFLFISSVGLLFPWLTIACQNVLSICSILLVIDLFRKLNIAISYKVAAVLFIAGISQFIYANLLMSEILFQFFILLLCRAAYEVHQRGRWKDMLIYQLIVVMLFLIKPVFYLFLIPNLLLAPFLNRDVKSFVLAGMIPIVLLFAYLQRNYAHTGTHDFSSIQNVNLVDYNIYLFHLSKYGKVHADSINRWIDGRAEVLASYEAQQASIRADGVQVLKEDLWSYLIFHVKGSIKMIIDPGRFDLFSFVNRNDPTEIGFSELLLSSDFEATYTYIKRQSIFLWLVLLTVLLFNILKAIGVVRYIFVYIREFTVVHVLILLVTVYIVAVTGAVGASRFMVPVLPLWTAMAAAGWTWRSIN